MKKRMIALLAGTAILCSLIGCTPAEPKQTESSTPETTQAALTHNHQADNNKEWMPWTSTDSLPGQADGQYNYYLTADVKLSKSYITTDGTDTMICLNGHSVTAPESSTGFILTKQTRLYISDCTDQPGTIYPSACEAGAFQLNADMGMLVLENVTVDGTDVYTESQNIGAIHINKCTGVVRLDGATIKGCTAVNGPAIYAEGRPNSPAVVTIANGSRITGNKVTASSEGSAAVLGKHASITVSDSTLTDNESEAICGVALSFASAGSLTLHNAVITGNRSLYSDMTNLQVGALYIHNGNRNLTISGDTVIEGNTRIDGEPADIYLQRTVREVNPDRWPHPFHLQLGTLTENASINICPGLGYEQEMLKEDITELPLLAFVPEADTEQWQPQWLRIDQWDMLLAYNPVESKFDLVRNTSNRQAAQ